MHQLRTVKKGTRRQAEREEEGGRIRNELTFLGLSGKPETRFCWSPR